MDNERSEWISPEIVELTIDEATELTNIDLASAGSTPWTYRYDHG